MSSKKKSILEQIQSRKGHPLFVKDWQVTVHVRSLSVTESERHSARAADESADHTELAFDLVTRHMLDENDEPVLEPGDTETLKTFGTQGVMEVFYAIMERTNGRSVEEALGNSEGTTTPDSSIG